MTALIPSLLGGIGLFLLGMTLLTDGAKGFAGDSLRLGLLRFTGTPWKAFLSGSVATLLVQSSSATTVTVIGFVSAGLLTFPQALGVVFGASLGTTGTGWIVAVFGLKISLGIYALPLVGLGAFLRVLGRGRWRLLGLGIAGFGLIFLGIDFLQEGMGALRDAAPSVSLPSGGLVGHLVAMAAGIVITLVLQSSSAAIAVTMTALHSGALNFEQAASLAVGASIGTTFTALLASIGATNPAKRTAVAFVLFNLVSGFLAILLLPILLRVVAWESVHFGLNGGATSLAAFHTTFVGLGVLVFLPIVTPYSRFIERLIPDQRPALARYLDKSLLQTPSVALEAVRRALRDATLSAMDGILSTLDHLGNSHDSVTRQQEIVQAIEEIQLFLARIPPDAHTPPGAPSRIALLHVIDHLIRLQSRIAPSSPIRSALSEPQLQEALALAKSLLQTALAGLREKAPAGWEHSLEENSKRLAEVRRHGRATILDEGLRTSPEHTLQLLDAMRWIDRVGYHTWRICLHLPAGSASPQAPAQIEAHPDE
jgi:phosphate:Na+ symporter